MAITGAIIFSLSHCNSFEYRAPVDFINWAVENNWLGSGIVFSVMDFLPDTENGGLRMRREGRERFPRHRGLAILTCMTAHA